MVRQARHEGPLPSLYGNEARPVSRQTRHRLGRLAAGALAALAAVSLAPAPAAAHPHVWIAARLAVVTDAAGRIAALDVDWTFDEMYSAYATADMPKGKDGKPTAEALATLARQMLANLAEWRYFTEVARMEVGDIADNQRFGTPEEATARLDGKGLAVAFRLPLAAPLLPDGQRLVIRQYDPSFYVAIEPAKNGIALATPLAATCTTDIAAAQPPQTALNLSEGSFRASGGTGGIGAMFAASVTVECR